MPITLNPAQQAAITTALRHLEDALREGQASFDPQDERILSQHTSTLSPQHRHDAQGLIEAMLAEIAAFSEIFGLEPKAVDHGSKLSVRLAMLWVDLYDTRSEMLEHSGEIASELDDILDPALMRMGGLIYELINILRPNQDSNGSQP